MKHSTEHHKDEQPIPVNQKTENELWEEAAKILYKAHNSGQSETSLIGSKILNGFINDMSILSKSFSIQLKSSPSPTPVQDFWKDLFYRLEAIVIRLRNMNTNVIATNTYQNVLDEIKQLKSNSSPVQEKIDEDEFADWEQVNCGIGAAIAVFNECKISVPEDHPDPTAINDCINATRDAQVVFNKLKKKYLESTPVQEGLNYELAKEAIDIIEGLVYFSQIHEVKGVVLPKGNHESFWKRGQQFLWDKCRIIESEYFPKEQKQPAVQEGLREG